MGGFQRRRRGPLPFRHVMLLSLFIFSLLTIQGLWLVNRSIEPTLITYAETQTKRLATAIITQAVNDKVGEGFNTDKLITIQTDNDGSVSTMDFNTEVVNAIATSTTSHVETYLHMAEKGKAKELGVYGDPKFNLTKNLDTEGILFAVPLGQVTKNALLGNLGPNIPVTFTTIGDVKTKVNHQIEQYGINNALVRIFVEVEVTLQVIIPFETKQTTVKTNIPIATTLVQGKVPSYYNGGGNGAAPAIPILKEDEKKK
ncbi:sporulation protein YunB [Bacillus sp. 165]|uniref:sporulation protein YunB n=1 Tax=Bacillus sp. 165 TaxID=1529117 RepID=UPI001AD9EC6D|nr:sporulation protein YunB [Bacillus sp. 165]MBO9130710.1 sporulation protein YunB [Bacillus sp. 165]